MVKDPLDTACCFLGQVGGQLNLCDWDSFCILGSIPKMETYLEDALKIILKVRVCSQAKKICSILLSYRGIS